MSYEALTATICSAQTLTLGGGGVGIESGVGG